jgi:hypothetical protein
LECFPHMRSDIQFAESIGAFWIDLIANFQRLYGHEPHDELGEAPEFVRALCLYATWCAGSRSLSTRQAAWIEFYEYLPAFALRCPEIIYRRIVRDLVTNIGIGEVEKMGCSLKLSDLNRFLSCARESEDERKRRSQKL